MRGCLALWEGGQRLPRPLARPVPVFRTYGTSWIRCFRRVLRVDTPNSNTAPLTHYGIAGSEPGRLSS